MAIGKKAALFTIVAIILVTSLSFYYISSNAHSDLDTSKVIESRILSMDSLISDIEHDIERGLYISAIRSLIGISEHITGNGSFLTDFQVTLNEIMINGTVDNKPINISQEANFGTWMTKIQAIGSNLDVGIVFTNLQINSYQLEPWSIYVNIIGDMNLSDNKGLAQWNRTFDLTTKVSILDFEDPLYTITSKGRLTNKIVMSNITDYVDGTDASNLILHSNNSWYIASESAPSFIMRYEGNLSNSTHGIESIVNVEILQVAAPEIYISDSSSIDYIYLGNSSISNCQINETYNDIPWLRLDNNHLATYEVTCV